MFNSYFIYMHNIHLPIMNNLYNLAVNNRLRILIGLVINLILIIKYQLSNSTNISSVPNTNRNMIL